MNFSFLSVVWLVSALHLKLLLLILEVQPYCNELT
jgi:hypothetical protein